MRVMFNAQALQCPATRHRGIGRYVRNMLIGMRNARPDWEITFLEAGHLPPADRPLPPGLRYRVYHAPLGVDGSRRPVRWACDRHFGDWVARQAPDVLVSGCVFEGDGVHAEFAENRVPHVAVSYDLIPVVYEGHYLRERIWAEMYADRMQLLRNVDAILAISESAAGDFRRLMPHARGGVFNVRGAVDDRFTPGDEPVRPFLLNGAGDDWRKNMRGALEAYALLPAPVRDEYEWVIACGISGREADSLRRRADELGVGDRVRLTGAVTDDELVTLYRQCRLFVFPSLYEGMGLPVVEAMRCGAPVVTSDCSSLPEYAGPMSWTADPLDAHAIAGAITDALAEPYDERREERIAFASRFTPRELGEAVCRVIEQRPWADRPVRPRLAWVRGVTAAEPLDVRWRDVLSRLGAAFTIDVVTRPDCFDNMPELGAVMPVLRADEFPIRRTQFEYREVVYHYRGDDWFAGMMGAFPGVLFAESGEPPPELVQRATAVITRDPGKWAAWRKRFNVPVIYLPPGDVRRTAAWLGAMLSDRRENLSCA